MARKSEDIQKHTLNLTRGDYAKLQELYPEIGAAQVIRRLVRQFIEQVETGVAGVNVNVDINL